MDSDFILEVHLQPSQVALKSIHIYSKNLRELLGTVVQTYGAQSLKGEKIIVYYPFEVLAHYYRYLVALNDQKMETLSESRHRSLEEATQSGFAPQISLDHATATDLGILLSFCKPSYTKHFALEEEKYNTGVCSYVLLWFLFKSGSKIMLRLAVNLQGLFLIGVNTRRIQRQDIISGRLIAGV